MTNLNTASLTARAKRLRVTTLLGGAALLLLSGTTSQAAITPSNVDAWQHIVDCAGALFTNPAEHGQFCTPGPEPMTFRTNFMSKGEDPPAIIPPPPPPPPEECDGPCEVVVLDMVGE